MHASASPAASGSKQVAQSEAGTKGGAAQAHGVGKLQAFL